MKTKNERTKRGGVSVISLILVFIAVAGLIGSLAFAKYVTQKPLQGKIKVSAKLAAGITVYEHEAEITPHGDYETTTDTTDGNEYTLMPGVDVPKDPTVRVEGYTGLPAWLYVKITESTGFPDTVTYAVADGWTELEGYTDIWYRELGSSDVTEDGNLDIQILKDNQLVVSDRLDRSTTASLSFEAYIVQIASTAKADFDSAYGN